LKEKTVQRLLEIPDYIINKIDKDESINSFINRAIINNICTDISFIKISKKTHTIPVRVRIKTSTYTKLKELISKYNISIQKLILHFILLEL